MNCFLCFSESEASLLCSDCRHLIVNSFTVYCFVIIRFITALFDCLPLRGGNLLVNSMLKHYFCFAFESVDYAGS